MVPSQYVWFFAGATQALGMLGAAFGEGPVALLMGQIGWRNALIWMGVIFFVLSLLVGLLVREKPTQASHAPSSFLDLKQGLWFVLRNRQTWWNALFAALMFAPTGTFAELWGVTYVEHVHGLTHALAAQAISMIFLGWGLGGPLCGWLSDRMKQRKPIMHITALLSALFLMLALYWPGMPTALLFICLFCFGLANSGLVIAYALSGEINPQVVAGISIAFANMASVILAPLFQDLGGWILVSRWQGVIKHGVPYYDVTSYEWSTFMLPLSLLLAFFVAHCIKETHCQRIEER